MARDVRWALVSLFVVVGCDCGPVDPTGDGGDVVADAGDGSVIPGEGDADVDAHVGDDAGADADVDAGGDAGQDAGTTDAGMPAVLVANLAMHDFGTRVVPASESVVVEIRNDGERDSDAVTASIEGDAVFTVSATTCEGVVLAPSETCAITLALAGDVPGDYEGSLEVTGGASSVSIQLAALLVPDDDRADVTLVFERVAGATGRVTSRSPVVNESFDCTEGCTRSLAVGSTVTFTAAGDHGFFLSAWEGGCEGTTRDCTFVVDEPTTITVRLSPANRVFTSQLTYTMAEIKAAATDPTDEATKAKSGADAICRALGGSTFQAWLGVPDHSPVAQRPPGIAGFVRVDQRPFANVFAADMHTYFPPGLDQDGVEVENVGSTWSGVSQAGTSRLRDTCQGWTSSVNGPADLAIVHARGANWPTSSSTGCGPTQSHHLFCYESERSVDVTPPPPPAGARRIFLGGDFNPSDAPGLAGVDAICDQQADEAGLVGTFRAMLATNGASVASRFVARGAPVYRTDGVELAPDEATFFSSSTGARAPIMTDASGARGPTFGYAWVGSSTWTAAGQAGATCTDWTASTGQGVRRSMNELPTSSYFGTSNCVFSAYVFCLEE